MPRKARHHGWNVMCGSEPDMGERTKEQSRRREMETTCADTHSRTFVDSHIQTTSEIDGIFLVIVGSIPTL